MGTWFVTTPAGKYDKRGRYPLDPMLEDQFAVLFGDPPPVGNERSAWEFAKKTFAGIVAPEGVPARYIERALDEFELYGLPEPIFYKMTNGRTLARFPDNPIDINPDAAAVLASPGATIAAMQRARIERKGEYFPLLHDWVPPNARMQNEKNREDDVKNG